MKEHSRRGSPACFDGPSGAGRHGSGHAALRAGLGGHRPDQRWTTTGRAWPASWAIAATVSPASPGSDPRGVTADGSGTPVDVAANLTDPRAVGLAAGVAEFELPDPVVAIQGSATASAPHLVMSLDTRGRAGVTVRLLLRDIDATAHDAVEPVALQYRVGAAGPFAACRAGTSPTPPAGRARPHRSRA